jgi:HAD superfamily phosphoserine phosphatase-like hydrolase
LRLVVLSDFDGTIVQNDTAAFVLERFATGDWKTFDEQLERGEIDLEGCMRKQFTLVKVSEKEILKEVIQVTAFRPNFEALAGFCKTKNIPFVVVTAGLDFIVNHFLRPSTREIEVVAPEAECTSKGIEFKNFPKLRYRESYNFKDDLVRHCKKQGKKVVYIASEELFEHLRTTPLLSPRTRLNHLNRMMPTAAKTLLHSQITWPN